MTRKFWKAVSMSTLILVATSTAVVAQATNVSTMVTGLQGQMKSMATLAGYVAFLAGFVFGIMGFLKLKANAQNPQDPSNKVSTGFMLIFIGAALIAVPTVMGIGITTLFGQGSTDKVDLNAASGSGFLAIGGTSGSSGSVE